MYEEKVNMKLLLLLLPLILLLLLCLKQADSFVVFGYLPEWRYHSLSFESVSQHVTHIIFFSLEMDDKTGKITAMDRFPNKEILDRARSLKNEVKLYICFGGNGRSNGFKLVLDENKRKVFLKELISLVEKYDLDGIDYNWEYPGYSHGAPANASQDL